MSTITRKQFRRLVAGPNGLKGLVTGVAEDGAETQASNMLVDAGAGGLLDNAYPAARFTNTWWRVGTETHRTLQYNPSAGSVEIGGSFATTPVTGVTEYEGHTHGASPDDLDAHLNWALSACRKDDYSVLCGLVEDGTCEAADTAAWGSSTAALTKTDYDDRRALRVTTSGAGGYASQSITTRRYFENSQPTYKVYATVAPQTGTATLVVRDASASQDIAVQWEGDLEADATVSTAFRNLVGNFTLPTNCASLQLRLVNDTNGAVTYWRDIGLLQLDAEGVLLPEWLDNPQQMVVNLYARDRWGRLSALVSPPRWRPDASGRLLIPIPPALWYGGVPVLQAARPYDELSADEDTIPAHLTKVLMHGVIWKTYEGLAVPQANNAVIFERLAAKHEAKWKNMQAIRNPINANGRLKWGAGEWQYGRRAF